MSGVEPTENGESYRPVPILLVPDQLATVLSIGDRVYYEDSGLSQELILDLRLWSKFYRQSFDENQAWISVDREREFTAMGDRLAQRLADELGESHSVQVGSRHFGSGQDGEPLRTYRSAGPAISPLAAEVFHAYMREEQAVAARQAYVLAQRHGPASFGWFLSDYAPD